VKCRLPRSGWLWFTFGAVVVTSLAVAQGYDIGKALGPSFSDVALLPTRLTYYNLHDDSARATYTCCKPQQEEQIAKALAANAAFLEKFPRTDYSDDTCMHNTRVNSVRRNFRYQVAALQMLVEDYPDSDLADDAAWNLAQCYIQDKDHGAAIDTLNLLLTHWPQSTWADDALAAISAELKLQGDEPEAFRAMQDLAYKYPASDFCPAALYALAVSYQQEEDYEAVLKAASDLRGRYPDSDYADDGQFMIAEALRHLRRAPEAVDAYRDLIEHMPGSVLTNAAMRECNTLVENMRNSGVRIDGTMYTPREDNPGQEASELYDIAMHHQNYREYAAAIQVYREFVGRFPGHDNYDDALFNIGKCYQNLNILFEDMNKAKGPEDLFRLKDDFADATGSDSLPAGKLSAIKDATAAYAIVANDLVGSPLRDEALYEIAESYRNSAQAADEAFTCQEIVIHFPGSPYEFEALYRLLKFYADMGNWETTQKTYPQLAKALPKLFPIGLADDKEIFSTIIGAYSRHVSFAWSEYFDHHIPYAFTIDDLTYDADFYLGALLCQIGDYPAGLKRLARLCKAPTNDLSAPAIWVSAQAYRALGDTEKAKEYYEGLIADYEWSGLADDARTALAALDEDLAPYLKQAGEAVGRDLTNSDVYVGEHVVVIAPFVVCAKMRQYNMPNIWENAVTLMADWTGREPGGKVVVYVDPTGAYGAGNPVRVPAGGIADPPQWSLGLEPIARNYVDAAAGDKLGEIKTTFCAALAQFAAASLQYDLVTETRDAIGSAEAVALPQEEVVRTRERSLAALEEYVRQQKSAKDLDPDTACGMLFALLDQRGFSRSKLVDREPLREVFVALQKQSGKPGCEAIGCALNEAMGGGCEDLLAKWGLAGEKRVTQR
jgi:TolA-binding protein